jgi:translation initiation factor IF-3
MQWARDAGMDLVEVSPHEVPPVCRIMDYGKHKYEQRKRQKKTQSHEQVLKEIRLRPKTDDNDRRIKMNRAKTFLDQGHKVQFTMLFRGRERAHRDLALKAFQGIVESFGEAVKVERPARIDGRRMTMVLAPSKVVKA